VCWRSLEEILQPGLLELGLQRAIQEHVSHRYLANKRKSAAYQLQLAGMVVPQI